MKHRFHVYPLRKKVYLIAMRRITFLMIFLTLAGCQNALQKLARMPQPRSFINVVVDDVNEGVPYKPCEPSIYVNPVNPENMVVGVVLDKTLHSFDGGKTWQAQRVKSPYGVFGDPVICADYDGNFYYAHLADPEGRGRSTPGWLDRIVIQKSTDGGISWNEGSYTGHRPPADQDKQWLTADPKNNHLYITWTEFDKYGSNNPEDRSRILFSRSTDQAETWSEAIPISELEGDCLDGDQTTEGAVPCVGPKGEVYVAWSYDEAIYFDRSSDGGRTWLDHDIKAAVQPGGWDIEIPGFGRANGMPVTACDRSKSPYRGTVYINYCDQSNGSDDTDVWLVKSSDGGNTWSVPVRVNDDPAGRHQFFTWMTIDQTTGAIYIVFYDRRHYEDFQTDVYLAYSFDGGSSFKNVRISEKPFNPSTSVFLGDYNNISAHDGVVRPVWTRLDGSRTSILTALVNFRL
jgi:hypothetical protein